MPQISEKKSENNTRPVNNVADNAPVVLPAVRAKTAMGYIIDGLSKLEADSIAMNSNGQFDMSNAAYNFAKGFFAPIIQAFQSPKDFAVTLTMVIAAIGATAALPVAMSLSLFALGAIYTSYKLFQFIKTVFTHKDIDQLENAFTDLGEAAGGALASYKFIKQFTRWKEIVVSANNIGHSPNRTQQACSINPHLDFIRDSTMPSKASRGLLGLYLSSPVNGIGSKEQNPEI